MKYLFHEILLVLGLSFLVTTNAYTQNHSRLCICFKENAKYIDMNYSEDSTLVAFNIVREGFETEEQRKSAKKKWYKDKFPRFEPPIGFYYRFLSNKKPEKLNSISEIDNCATWAKLEEYRKQNFKYPEGIGGSKVYFIQVLPEGSYLKWDALMMAIE